MRAIQKDFYQILGVSRSASQDDIHSRFLELSRDMEILRNKEPWFPVDESILEITKAYLTLIHPSKREKYNKKIDFDIVVIDKDIDKTELAGISLEYKRHCASNYDELVSKFEYFKKELNSSLWIIKTTSIFLIFAIITSAIFTFSLFVYFKSYESSVYPSIDSLGIVIFTSVILFQYWMFRIIWQKKKAKQIN